MKVHFRIDSFAMLDIIDLKFQAQRKAQLFSEK